MSNTYSVDELLGFLDHASARGLLPPATATALAVACRNVFKVLNEDEKGDVTQLDLAKVISRFQNRYAKNFSPPTLKEYGRRTERAVALFRQWRDDPANFQAPTRATTPSRQRKAPPDTEPEPGIDATPHSPAAPARPGTYNTSVPIGPNRIVTLSNVPADLTRDEAKKLADFVAMLAVN